MSEQSQDRGTTAEHPGVAALFAVLAYGELAAFQRLSKESEMAPDLRGRIAVASMAAAQMRNFELLDTELDRRGQDVTVATAPFVPVITRYHERTTPRNWNEALVKAYIGDGLAADFYSEVARALPGEPASVVAAVLSDTRESEFAVSRVRGAISANPALRSPLTLWGRRLLSEAITQAQEVLATRDELAALLFEHSADLPGVAQFFESLQTRHAERMATLGLG
ncbi:ferritin-like fold-containing protein [Tsukamurella pseudospumae]|uniref:Hydroxylase n=1 Tax=Tsukamurella pseudospumae TaxID=239498 RepID=A0A138ABP3_9ACTN|nr:ferritin-like fold-containing protein [Tsukamurella pseudospumae]KXP01036.1 hydroxylase [Tsukamurella pseudospumae]KXP07863.1 hydroxylase [Tsukamurella pseudospumae]